MNNEIKKIIRELKDSIKEHKKEKRSISAGMGMTWEEWDIFFEYFDNLQQENERLEKRNKEIYDGFLATQEELTDYAEELEEEKRINQEDLKYIDELNERIDYSINYIKNVTKPRRADTSFHSNPIYILEMTYLLNILNSRSDE